MRRLIMAAIIGGFVLTTPVLGVRAQQPQAPNPQAVLAESYRLEAEGLKLRISVYEQVLQVQVQAAQKAKADAEKAKAAEKKQPE
jgi:hypothetical protein